MAELVTAHLGLFHLSKYSQYINQSTLQRDRGYIYICKFGLLRYFFSKGLSNFLGDWARDLYPVTSEGGASTTPPGAEESSGGGGACGMDP